MNVFSKVAGVVLATTALAGVGAGVASAATVSPSSPASHDVAQVGSAPVGRFFTDDWSKSYKVVISGYSSSGDFADAPAVGTTIKPNGDEQMFDLNTTGKTVAEGVVDYTVMTSNGFVAGSFEETLLWINNGTGPNGTGTGTGQDTIAVSNQNLPDNVKVSASVDQLTFSDI